MTTSNPEATAPPTTRRQRTEQTRERVLAVATELMARRGYSGTSISAISKASGAMPASIYWHFESKEGLLGAVIERAAEAWFEGALRAMDQGEAEQHARGLDAASENRPALRYVLVDQAEFYRVLLMIALERRDETGPPLAAVRRIRARMRERFQERVEVRLGERLGVDNLEIRQWIARRIIALAMVQLDGTFLEQQLDPVDGAALAERFDRIGWILDLAREDLLRQAGVESATAPAVEGAS
jgi:AcrR family transcriptional regulator